MQPREAVATHLRAIGRERKRYAMNENVSDKKMPEEHSGKQPAPSSGKALIVVTLMFVATIGLLVAAGPIRKLLMG